MNKTKKLIEEAILFSIDSIRADIATSVDADENKTNAESIKLLAEAYDLVHRGKREDF